MDKIILFGFLLIVGNSFAQDEGYSRLKAELVEWDAVRGEWLAESFNAMADSQPIPDRTFPEDLTPVEMYLLVPTDRQKKIKDIVNNLEKTSALERRSSSEGELGIKRIPVGETNTLRQQTTSNRESRYNYYVTRSGCDLTMGRSYGDPHIRTFDGKTYSFQTVGEYILSGSPDRTFEVQARQRPQTEKVSLNTAVAMNVYGDRIGIYASDFPDGQSGTPLRVNGSPVYLNNETFYLPHGGTVQQTGKEYIVTWPTGEKVQARMMSTSGMKFMNLSVYVYECNGNYYGLMGNANGRSDDDFSGGDNSVNLASSTIFDPFGSRDFGRSTNTMEREHLAFLARNFGNQFLVNDKNSLFDYGFGQSSWTFYDPSFPHTHLTLGDISQIDRDRARRECESQGVFADEMAGCIIDLAHANIQPTPRPTTPNRISGRELQPVSERRANVNRSDVFERERIPGGRNDVRTPSEIRDNNSGSRGTGTREESINSSRTSETRISEPVRETTTIRSESGGENGKEIRKPIETSNGEVRSSGTTTDVKSSSDRQISRPSSTNSEVERRDQEIRKPVDVFDKESRPSGNQRNSNSTNQRVAQPATIGTDSNSGKVQETRRPVESTGGRSSNSSPGTTINSNSVDRPASESITRPQTSNQEISKPSSVEPVKQQNNNGVGRNNSGSSVGGSVRSGSTTSPSRIGR